METEAQRMSHQEAKTDADILTAWYEYAAEQPGFVGAELRRLRDRTGTTLQEQQEALGANEEAFLRLQAMPMPRPDQVIRDAQRMAEQCFLKHPSAFVQAMLLTRTLRSSLTQHRDAPVYRAAFDASDELDALPEEP